MGDTRGSAKFLLAVSNKYSSSFWVDWKFFVHEANQAHPSDARVK
jgi:hypothetical protein